MTGQVGRYFYSFGITSAAAILISMFVSFTLTPALCARWLKPEDAKSDHSDDQVARRLREDRPRATGGCSTGRCTTARVMLAHRRRRRRCRPCSCIPYVGKELVPDDDQGEFSVNVRLPRGTSYPRTEEFIAPIEKDVLALPEVRARDARTSTPGSANFYVRLTPLEEREDLAAGADAPGARRCCASTRARASASRAAPTSPARRARGGGGGGGGGGGNRLHILIQGPDIEQLQAVHGAADGQGPRRSPASSTSTRNFEPTQPELRVNVDRARAADLGVNIDSLANEPAHAGRRRGSLGVQGRRRSVQGRCSGSTSRSATIRRRWASCWCPPRPGKTVKVSDVAQLTHGLGPASIDRYNRQRQISVNANLDRRAARRGRSRPRASRSTSCT